MQITVNTSKPLHSVAQSSGKPFLHHKRAEAPSRLPADFLQYDEDKLRKVSRSEMPALYAMVEQIAHQGGVGEVNIFIKKGEYPNASACEGEITFTRGLLRMWQSGKLGREEIQGTVAHEIGHMQPSNMIPDTVAVYTLIGLTIAGAVGLFRTSPVPEFFLDSMYMFEKALHMVGKILVFGVAEVLVAVPLLVIASMLNEFSADSFAARLGYGTGLSSSLLKYKQQDKELRLAGIEENKQGIKHKLLKVANFLSPSHPSVGMRIRNIKETTERGC